MRMMQRCAMMCVVGLMSAVAMGQGHGGPPPANDVVDEVRVERLVQRRVVTGEIR